MSRSRVAGILGGLVVFIVTVLGVALYPEQILGLAYQVWAWQALWHGLGVAFVVLIMSAIIFEDTVRNLILQPQVRAHDLDLFLATCKIIPECQLLDFIGSVGGYGRGDYSTLHQMRRCIYFSREPLNEYGNRRIQRRWTLFIAKLDDLDQFIIKHTFPSTNNRDQLTLVRKDEIDHEESDRVFEQEAAAMFDRAQAADRAYLRYIAVLKKYLPEARKLANEIAEADSAA